MIVLSADGKVAEQGPYSVLSRNPDGAFTKLMEWQLNGGATTVPGSSTELDNHSDEEEDIAVGEETHREIEEELDNKETKAPRSQSVTSDLGLNESERGRP